MRKDHRQWMAAQDARPLSTVTSPRRAVQDTRPLSTMTSPRRAISSSILPPTRPRPSSWLRSRGSMREPWTLGHKGPQQPDPDLLPRAGLPLPPPRPPPAALPFSQKWGALAQVTRPEKGSSHEWKELGLPQSEQRWAARPASPWWG